jgi:transcriptional regulator with XRE-family HTH domain
MNDHERRIARARLLRREGKTYNEIRAVLGPMSEHQLECWLRGIPRPRATLRGRAKDDKRRECRRLRAQGLTYDEIAAKTGASKGSISPWVSDVTMPPNVRRQRRVRSQEARQRVADALRQRAARRRDAIRQSAAAAISSLTERELLIAGVALYWAEGSKDKPWRRSGRVVLINSDAGVLKLFLAWLDLVGVSEQARTYRLNIHETADVGANERWWADRLQIPLASFAPATLKKHNPKTVRHNCGEDYHGCLVVCIARSGWLYYAIEGWWNQLLANASAGLMVHTETATDPP